MCIYNNNKSNNIPLKEVSAKYWPNKGDDTMKVGPFMIDTTSETEWDKYFIRRIMRVKMVTGIKVIHSLGCHYISLYYLCFIGVSSTDYYTVPVCGLA